MWEKIRSNHDRDPFSWRWIKVKSMVPGLKADILGIPVKVIDNSESTACMGCAIWAGVANGIWDSVEEAADQFVKVKEIYEPNKENEQIYQQVYEKYVEITKVLNPTF